MNQFFFGFVYVLQNEAMPGIVKIGFTSKLAEDRANELFKTAVPFPFEVIFRALTSHPKALEKAVHEELQQYRINSAREFFQVRPEIAIATILKILQKIDGIETWAAQKDPILLRAGDRLQLSLKADQVFAVFYYPTISSKEADILDIWQAHTDGDRLELYVIEESEATSGFSNNELYSAEAIVPNLNRDGTVSNDTIIGRERFVPGQRLLWMDDSDESSFVKTLFEFASHCQLICRTSEPKFLDEANPLLLNYVTRQELSPAIISASHKALSLPIPRNWAPLNPKKEEGWSDVDSRRNAPEFWLPQLRKHYKPQKDK